jgi:NADH-quinone oxidoreductase E subunit
VFDQQELQEIEALKKRYEEPKAALLPVLWRIQRKMGYIDDVGMDMAARLCEVPKSHVQGVVTFYTMYFDEPMGRFHVQVCTNVSCMLVGGEKLYREMKERLGIGHRERTHDGMFSLEEVECMGACGGAPMIAVNEMFYERVTSDEAEQIISHVREKNEIPRPKFVQQMPDLSVEANQ